MIALLKLYGFGVLATMAIMGYLSAAYALKAQATLEQGMALFSGDAAAKQLALTFIWPLILMYVVSYYVMVYFMLYSLNKEMKNRPPPLVPQPVEPGPVRPIDPNMN